ncbi:uncharacterized protein N7498_009531 [Penicillium cinerascens]|uniref:DUF7703 domain-containing protein n=1 Tax=Penicillium cinerascens TaxID=70096 RepID=A0A9W9JA52_9EURO|nr:uncharacterized protein N7498_009531 [Penicillium cinerascens]KAJ5190546.1 hypothetical protein N7498_009531 [Penicillium cinerascens]
MSTHDISDSGFGLSERSVNRFAERTAVACLIALAWYNALELVVLCFTTFKRYGGCYFWCLLISSMAIIPFGLGYLLIIFDIYNSLFSVAMELIAWVCMVTGQSLVLWSRLHLVVQNRSILRWTLAMIIVDAIVFQIPASVLELGSHSNKSYLFTRGFNVFERIQLIAFSLQEVVLSVIYSWEAVRLLNLRPRGHYRSTLVQLLIVNLAMILMDAAVIGVQYSGLFDIHVTLKAFVYSVKLKLEYAILGKLVVFTEMCGSASQPTDLSDFVDLSFHPNQSGDRDSQARIYDTPESNLPQRVHVASKQPSDSQIFVTSDNPSLSNEAL